METAGSLVVRNTTTFADPDGESSMRVGAIGSTMLTAESAVADSGVITDPYRP